ncbi:conserved domain protein [Treponema primitia ZAS-2]|uniref:Probable membrane transporter protein n=1 Tax=Treponema primitia (strain ATCC BAA-887 / DSM 12427 / ZAS-2) TaxID=545694 RepID=F5YHT8_TREPZ|nr:sulfite exporter TauE/SafE family protein [Treponema primitia]AEF85915.1 conserved domain protein [Treponema primitia ZAS-2]
MVPATPLNMALLLIIGFFSGVLSGAIGFGGALILLPVLNITLGGALAAPVLTVAQLMGNSARVALGWRQINWKPVICFISGAVPLTIAGAWFFTIADKSIITKITGGFIILFVLIKFFKIPLLKGSNMIMVFGGGLTGFLSGLIGSAGPVGASFFLSLNLSPLSYIASEAVTATVMHIIKLFIYRGFMEIGYRAVVLGVLIGISMVAGVWLSKKGIERIPREKFQIGVSVLLIAMGVYMSIAA